MKTPTRALVWTGLWVVTGCALKLPLAPLLPQEDPAFLQAAVPEPAGLSEEPGGPFRLMAGDLLDLRTLSKTPIEATGLLVDDGGGLHVPHVGRVAVEGLSLREAEVAIERELGQFDRFSRVGLSVREAAGHWAVVVGAVNRPGRVAVRPGLRVVEVLAAGGGLKTVVEGSEEFELADVDAARLLRGRTPLPVSLRRALEGDLRHNVRVAAGDVLFVPPVKARRISVLGRVKSAKTIPFRAGLRLTEALAMAGGADKGADEADIRVIRGPLSKPKVYLASVKRLVGGDGQDVVLAAGDIVYVTTHWFSTFSEVMQDLTPIVAASGVAAILATAR